MSVWLLTIGANGATAAAVRWPAAARGQAVMFGATLALSTLMLASAAMAGPLPRNGQTHLNNPIADLNGDGEVTLMELIIYNRNQRQS
jgi:hypothetical protein